MNKLVQFAFGFLFVFMAQFVFAWGQTGHRVVGYIAQKYLTPKASERIDSILGKYSLEMSGNYLDFIKADTNYRFMSAWHYVTIPDGMTYETSEKSKNGDVIWAIEDLLSQLKMRTFTSVKDEEFAIMALVHLVADLHQPLHVGNGKDRGGNGIKLQWFGEESNLHRVWDSDIIDHQQLSYTEFGNHINRNISPDDIRYWQGTSVRFWAKESQDLRAACYSFGEETNLKYEYIYQHLQTVETRLLQAGIRLAGLLNQLYG
jgi:hypothetical protein